MKDILGDLKIFFNEIQKYSDKNDFIFNFYINSLNKVYFLKTYFKEI